VSDAIALACEDVPDLDKDLVEIRRAKVCGRYRATKTEGSTHAQARAHAPRTQRRLDRIRRRRPALSRRAQARHLAALYSHPKIFPQSAKMDSAAT
jgi:hypothetical protein